MRNRTFYATFLLFLAALYAGILALSLIALRGTARAEKDQCLDEHYFISTALYQDLAALQNRGYETEQDLTAALQPYLYLAGNRGAVLAVYRAGRQLYANGMPAGFAAAPQSGGGETRTVSFQKEDERYFCSAWGALPQPFDDYLVLYQRDATGALEAWGRRNTTMLLAGGAVSLLLALFLLLLLEKLFRPLSQITRLSQKIAAGQYAARLPEQGKDEVAQMARSFNHMAGEVEHKITELAAAAEDKQRFVDNFAHELRTPLTAIYGYAEYMQKAALTEEDAQFALETILAESRRMQQMANQLMELSNLRRGEIRLEPLRLDALLASVRRTVAQKLAQKNVELRVRCQVETLTGDAVLLHSLLVNLIDNAVKASGVGGEVDMDAFYRDENPVITVTDRGKGMAPEELAHITEPYYRVDRARNSREGGAGLGLALCLQIARRHGAELSFASVPGQGTTATVTFTQP